MPFCLQLFVQECNLYHSNLIKYLNRLSLLNIYIIIEAGSPSDHVNFRPLHRHMKSMFKGPRYLSSFPMVILSAGWIRSRRWVKLARDQIHFSLLRNGYGSCFSAFPLFYVKEGHIIVIYKNYIGCLFDFICIFLQLIRTCLVMLNQCYKSWKILEKVVFFISPRIRDVLKMMSE
jgi:hypothetical protein